MMDIIKATFALIMILMKLISSKEILDKSNDEFQPIEIEYLTLNNFSDFKNVNTSALHYLKGISIINCKMKEIPYNLLGELPFLKQLILVNNYVQNFSMKGSFNYHFATNLETLNISKQEIGNLKNDSFTRFRKLLYFSLTCASLGSKTIEKSAFKGLDKLRILDLSGNQLRNISSDILAPLKGLEILILNYNEIKQFSTIPKLCNLEKIYLEENPIRSNIYVDRIALYRQAPRLKNIKFCTVISIACQTFENICG